MSEREQSPPPAGAPGDPDRTPPPTREFAAPGSGAGSPGGRRADDATDAPGNRGGRRADDTTDAPAHRDAAAPADEAGRGHRAAPDEEPAGYAARPVAVRRPDGLASLLLVLAGLAAGVSLLLRWLPGSDLTGLDLVRRGLDELGSGFGAFLDTGFWQPLAVILGGGVLFLLGLLVALPARRHRFLGLLALLVSLLAAAGVLVPLARTGWDPSAIDTGFWFAVAVPALGLLGALKALLTGRRYASRGA